MPHESRFGCKGFLSQLFTGVDIGEGNPQGRGGGYGRAKDKHYCNFVFFEHCTMSYLLVLN